MTEGPSGPGDRADGPGMECAVRLDQRSAFGLLSPRGTLRVVDGVLSWQPDGWRVPVWHVPARDVVGGEAGTLWAFELWLETSVTGTVAVAVEPPGGAWATGGGNVPDVRGQAALDGLVAALRRGGARILGQPRSLSSRPGHGGSGLSGPF